jgi:hypothetical protein
MGGFFTMSERNIRKLVVSLVGLIGFMPAGFGYSARDAESPAFGEAYGFIVDAVTGQGIDGASVRWYRGTDYITVKSFGDKGAYSADIPPDSGYKMEVLATGYITFIKDNVEIAGNNFTFVPAALTPLDPVVTPAGGNGPRKAMLLSPQALEAIFMAAKPALLARVMTRPQPDFVPKAYVTPDCHFMVGVENQGNAGIGDLFYKDARPFLQFGMAPAMNAGLPPGAAVNQSPAKKSLSLLQFDPQHSLSRPGGAVYLDTGAVGKMFKVDVSVDPFQFISETNKSNNTNQFTLACTSKTDNPDQRR